MLFECASSRSGPGLLGPRSPTDLCNIPEVAPQRQMIRPVAQVAQGIKGIKKEGESFGFSLFVAFYDLSFNFDLPYSRNQEGLSNKPAVHRIITLRL